jgi:hypothetical protein
MDGHVQKNHKPGVIFQDVIFSLFKIKIGRGHPVEGRRAFQKPVDEKGARAPVSVPVVGDKDRML